MSDTKNKSKEVELQFKKAYEAALKLPRTYINTRKNPKDKQVITLGFGLPIQISFFYEGEARGNFPDGLGKLTYQVFYGNLLKDNKVFYEGEFLAGEPNGKGKLTIREIDGDVTYETSEINTKNHKSVGKFKGLNLKADGFFNYNIKKNLNKFENGSEYLFKDHKGDSMFKEFGANTFVSGEDLTYKLQWDKYKEFYWFPNDSSLKMIYHGEVTQIGLHQERDKHKYSLARTFPIPHGNGEFTYLELNKNSEYYNMRDKRVGSINLFQHEGFTKEYHDDVLFAEGNYSKGLRNGMFKFYHKGKVDEEILFENGKEKK